MAAALQLSPLALRIRHATAGAALTNSSSSSTPDSPGRRISPDTTPPMFGPEVDGAIHRPARRQRSDGDSDGDGDNPRPAKKVAHWRNLSHTANLFIAEFNLGPQAQGRVRQYAQAPEDERLLMSFVNTERLLERSKVADAEYKISDALGKNIKTYVHACLLSAFIPSYSKSPFTDLDPLLREQFGSSMPAATNQACVDVISKFVSDAATQKRSDIKGAIERSFPLIPGATDATGKDQIRDVTRGNCLRDLVSTILGKRPAVTASYEVQARIAFLRSIYVEYPTSRAQKFWTVVDTQLKKIRSNDATIIAVLITETTQADLSMFTINAPAAGNKLEDSATRTEIQIRVDAVLQRLLTSPHFRGALPGAPAGPASSATAAVGA